MDRTPALPPPDVQSLVEREYRAKFTQQFKGEWTIHDPENPDAWIHSDVIMETN